MTWRSMLGIGPRSYQRGVCCGLGSQGMGFSSLVGGQALCLSPHRFA
jgi:hypothetical protein